MTDDENLKALINRLIETIQGAIQDSSEVNDILNQLEDEGYTLNVSMLIGIIIKDRDGEDMFFSSLPEDTKAFELYKQLLDSSMKKMETQAKPPKNADWNKEDRDYLNSIGIEFDTPHTSES